ncbi:hypothetical protein ACWD7F_15925 [Streptomyces sp. NPDC005122]
MAYSDVAPIIEVKSGPVVPDGMAKTDANDLGRLPDLLPENRRTGWGGT